MFHTWQGIDNTGARLARRAEHLRRQTELQQMRRADKEVRQSHERNQDYPAMRVIRSKHGMAFVYAGKKRPPTEQELAEARARQMQAAEASSSPLKRGLKYIYDNFIPSWDFLADGETASTSGPRTPTRSKTRKSYSTPGAYPGTSLDSDSDETRSQAACVDEDATMTGDGYSRPSSPCPSSFPNARSNTGASSSQTGSNHASSSSSAKNDPFSRDFTPSRPTFVKQPKDSKKDKGKHRRYPCFEYHDEDAANEDEMSDTASSPPMTPRSAPRFGSSFDSTPSSFSTPSTSYPSTPSSSSKGPYFTSEYAADMQDQDYYSSRPHFVKPPKSSERSKKHAYAESPFGRAGSTNTATDDSPSTPSGRFKSHNRSYGFNETDSQYETPHNGGKSTRSSARSKDRSSRSKNKSGKKERRSNAGRTSRESKKTRTRRDKEKERLRREAEEKKKEKEREQERQQQRQLEWEAERARRQQERLRKIAAEERRAYEAENAKHVLEAIERQHRLQAEFLAQRAEMFANFASILDEIYKKVQEESDEAEREQARKDKEIEDKERRERYQHLYGNKPRWTVESERSLEREAKERAERGNNCVPPVLDSKNGSPVSAFAAKATRFESKKGSDNPLDYFLWYESKWTSINASASTSTSSHSFDTSLEFSSIPWPICPFPKTTEEVTSTGVKTFIQECLVSGELGIRMGAAAKKELLNWHPDKFATRVLGRVRDEEEREVVRLAADVVQKTLTELMRAPEPEPEASSSSSQ